MKIRILLKNIYQKIKNLLIRDYSGNGQRQVAKSLKNIREDHLGRYIFAKNFIEENDLVLDCACGIGYGSFLLATQTQLKKITAMDVSKDAIKFGKRHYFNNKINYQMADIFNSDLPNNHFDKIISFETVEHVDDLKILKIFYKKLKKDGTLIISTPNEETFPYNYKSFPHHLRHYTPSEFKELLLSAGFEILNNYTQYDINKEDIQKGTSGLFNIAIAKKIKNFLKSPPSIKS